ncbi:Myb-like DNA-binding domain [Carpediemonas membranifera]|uniref:Myb-like DNA-binding domain n=1 Tax=Carpediemonas membranifera TaxID=201153 RepID=A0A8J6E2W2_9EUKA|nr:Myb-like DNA-binding domain [Carpediemonas membranifera]|eukprot:KAG9395168.1 Myb-like DNA-binding domain [Carpediemonas membranifera]
MQPSNTHVAYVPGSQRLIQPPPTTDPAMPTMVGSAAPVTFPNSIAVEVQDQNIYPISIQPTRTRKKRAKEQSARLIWSKDQHQRFEKAVLLIGLRTASPKSILAELNDPSIKRHHIASHLQKFRFKASKLLGLNDPSELRDEHGQQISGMIQQVPPGRPRTSHSEQAQEPSPRAAVQPKSALPPARTFAPQHKEMPKPANYSLGARYAAIREPVIFIRDPDRI